MVSLAGVGKVATSASKPAVAGAAAANSSKIDTLLKRLDYNEKAGNLDYQQLILESLISAKREFGSAEDEIKKFELRLAGVKSELEKKKSQPKSEIGGFAAFDRKAKDPFENPIRDVDAELAKINRDTKEGIKATRQQMLNGNLQTVKTIASLAGPEGMAAAAVADKIGDTPVVGSILKKTLAQATGADKRAEEAERAKKAAADAQKKAALAKLSVEQRFARHDISLRASAFFSNILKYTFLFLQTYVFSPIKLILTLFIIFMLFTLLVLGVVVLQGERCRDTIKTTEGASPFTNIYAQLINGAFLKCAFWDQLAKVWHPIQKLDVTNRVLTWMDQQIMFATGQYYFTKVDKNSEEKIGITIEKLELQESGYDINSQTLIYAKLKATGGDYSGMHYCSLRGKIGTSIPNDEFNLTENIPQEEGCKFSAGEITEPGRDYEFKFVVLSDVSTYAYSNPFFIKKSTYDIIKKDPKELAKIKERAGELLLKTTNAPMEIAGRIGSEGENFVIVEDKANMDQNVNKLEISFRKDWTTDDIAVIKKVKKFAVVLPAGIEIDANKGTDNKGKYCGSYAFEKINCDQLASYFVDNKDYDKRMCQSTDNVYVYDSSGTGDKLENINQEKKIQCVVKYTNIAQIFKDGGIDSSMKMLNIQTLATYSFEITRVATIKFTAKVPIVFELQKYTCEDSTIVLQNSVAGNISDDVKKEYRKYQDNVKQFVSSDIRPSGLSEEMFEGMVAAIMQKYTNNFDKSGDNDQTKDGRIDYLSNCRLPLKEPLRSSLAEDYTEDAKCITGSLASKYIVAAGDIDKTLALYYEDRDNSFKDAGQTPDSKSHAEKSDVIQWTKALCYPTSTTTAIT